MSHPTKRGRRLGIVSALALMAGLALSSGPAHADPTLNVNYDVNGHTTIASTGSDITLGPSVIYTQVGSAGDVTAQLDLPGTRTQFNLLGFLPVTADVNFARVGETTGTLGRDGRRQVLSTTSQYYVQLSNIKVVGFPLFAGPICRTKSPVTIDVATPADQSFNPLAGGQLTGDYTIGDFQNCGLNTWLINLIIPGSGNHIQLDLSGARVAS